MTLQDLLADAQIADDLEVSFGDKGKFKVGDLRSADKSRQTAHAAAVKAEKDAIALAEAKRAELTTLATEAATLIEKLKTTPPAAKADDAIDFDTDPLYAPLMKALIKPLQTKMAEYDTSIGNVNKAIAAVVQFGLNDHYERQWDRIPDARRPKDKTWKDYVKVAAEKKILNEYGLPDPIKAFNDEVQPLEMNTLAEENKKLAAQVEELKKSASAPRMPRPGTSNTPPSGQKDKGKVFDSVEDLVNEAFTDSTILEIAGRA